MTTLLMFNGAALVHAKKKKSSKIPLVEENEHGRILILPDRLANALEDEFPGYRIPEEMEYDDKMLKHFYSNLVGLHPAVTWGDFNGDKKTDYALLIITGDSPWGPLVELVIMNGKRKKGQFELFRLGEVYGHKDDYLRYQNKKLIKGDFKKGAWYINWDKKTKSYTIHKS